MLRKKFLPGFPWIGLYRAEGRFQDKLERKTRSTSSSGNRRWRRRHWHRGLRNSPDTLDVKKMKQVWNQIKANMQWQIVFKSKFRNSHSRNLTSLFFTHPTLNLFQPMLSRRLTIPLYGPRSKRVIWKRKKWFLPIVPIVHTVWINDLGQGFSNFFVLRPLQNIFKLRRP
jgi:hypothetical protein